MKEGEFEVIVYYTCSPENVGASFKLSLGSSELIGKITEAHNPPLIGRKDDRVERIESYVKDFKPLSIGNIHLKKGTGELTLMALDIPGDQVMDFRLIMMERVR